MSENKTVEFLPPKATPFYVKVRNLTKTVKIGKRKKSRAKAILDDISFYIKPGTMTLLLGAPGCGKSSLFRALANHKTKGEKQTGEVLFNGQMANKKTHHSAVAYVTQEDVHFPTLTVRETLQFSFDCQSSPNLSEDAKKNTVDQLLRLLDLSHVQNTLVGNDLIRGISGGQRKRVTIGVAMTASPSLIMMDEPTTGLDANTSLDVLTSMRAICDEVQTPVIAALLQPSPEICDLFDNLIILSKGKIGYFGPYKGAVDYFARLGLQGSMFQSDPEFLQEAIEYAPKYSKDNVTSESLISTYRESPEFRDCLEGCKADEHDISVERVQGDVEEHTYPTSFRDQVKLLLRREVMMMKKDRATVRSRYMKKVNMGWIVGTLFLQLPNEQSGLRTRLSLLFFTQLFLAFSNLGVISGFYRERTVFYMQRENKYYSPLAYFIAKSVIELPLVITENIIFGTILYWLVGLASDGGRYFFFMIMLMATELFTINFCKFISTYVPTEQVAAGITPAVFGILVLFAGFIIPPPSIPDWWLWIYYLAPFHYGLEGLMVNEMLGTNFHCADDELLPPSDDPNFSLPYPDGYSNSTICPFTTGEQQLKFLDMHTDSHWKWINFIIMLLFSAFFMTVTGIGFNKVHHSNKVAQVSEDDNKPIKASTRVAISPQEVVPNAIGTYMSWENLTYSVEMRKGRQRNKLDLLKSVSGYVRPGMLCALMGPSGAGKSTLLDVLANRKTGGFINGKVLVNGKPKDQFFSRFTGYVEQMDILMPLATVRETIAFSAQTRLPEEMSIEKKESKVDEVLQILDLEVIQDYFAVNLSMEQRKRLTIGVELVADPQLLFLDEPTSGLDSQAAVKVMDVVKKVADTGRSVICTIHQPSASVFTYFDHLLLLKKGGITVYFGPTGKDCREMLEYFESIGWVCQPKRNPADFILDVASYSPDEQFSADDDPLDDPVDCYNESTLKETTDSQLHYIPDGFAAQVFTGQYASTIRTQCKANLQRAWKNVVRNRLDIRARIMRSIVVSVLMGTAFLNLDTDQAGAGNRFSVVFFALIASAMGGNGSIPVVVAQRAVYYREQAGGAYRPIAYLYGLMISDLPMTIVVSITFTIPLYFLAGLRNDAEKFFFFLWIIFIYSLLSNVWAFFLAMALPNGEIAQAVAGICMGLFSLFGGFMITKPNIPDYWIWMYYISFMHYPLETLVTSELDGLAFHCNDDDSVPVPVPTADGIMRKAYCPIQEGNTYLDELSINVDNKYPNMGVTLGMWVGVCFLCFVALVKIRHITR